VVQGSESWPRHDHGARLARRGQFGDPNALIGQGDEHASCAFDQDSLMRVGQTAHDLDMRVERRKRAASTPGRSGGSKWLWLL
jgi:hypothetical protein